MGAGPFFVFFLPERLSFESPRSHPAALPLGLPRAGGWALAPFLSFIVPQSPPPAPFSTCSPLGRGTGFRRFFWPTGIPPWAPRNKKSQHSRAVSTPPRLPATQRARIAMARSSSGTTCSNHRDLLCAPLCKWFSDLNLKPRASMAAEVVGTRARPPPAASP